MIQVPNVGALPETVVQIEPYVTTEEVAESFTINVTLSDVQNLYGVKVIIRWNSDILQVVNVDVRLGVESHSDGVLHEDIFVVKNESRNDIGKYRLEAAS
ncbi:hypothetical protein GWN63_06060, partial [Candidatus Bathyarchaeota archaeon]|nr:hypothetical protein [Candidatus Bathyarchaeota archaeon]NIU81785.1 hypothetical protein [Candidatus Bathyarchaeota archaeon]NIV68424.1 hypothetical protein [Candidatus Bathyarchaeota archaeon]NIW16723.1 hypothetical protein [Candidatus Bathyarchaeota archaeon]